jgi:hypothetical protein
MVARETGFGVFTSAVLAMVALQLVACGESKRAGGAKGNGSGGSGGSGESGGSSGSAGSGGSGGSSGSTGGSQGGSNGVGGATGGSATAGSATAGNEATAGSGGGAGVSGAGSTGDAGGGGAGGDEESVGFHWIEATDEHRARATSSPQPAFLRTNILLPNDSAIVLGTSDLVIGENRDELYTEGFVWTKETGTTALSRLPGVTPYPFRTLSYPTATSADGSVVVGIADNSEGRYVPFRWTPADGMEAIAEEGSAVAVSADGSIVVGGLHEQRVFRWTRALGVVTIVEPLDGDDAIWPLALSDDGATVLGKSYRSESAAEAAGAAERLFVWTEGSGALAVANLPGYEWCLVKHARFNSSNRFVAGGWCFNEAGNDPYVWAGQDHLVAVGPADAVGVDELSDPIAVSADGVVAVGGASVGDESRVYRWTETNGLSLLELPQGYTSSSLAPFPEAMSEDGSVVVGSMSGSASHGFLWSESAGAVVLSPLDGHDISEAMVVSPDGSVAAGTSRLGMASSVAVYWRANGVPHRIADELAAAGIELGGDALHRVAAAQAPLGFLGQGSKDEVSTDLGWSARLR